MTTSINSQQSEGIDDERTNILEEYLELFGNLGYHYKYFMAPNAILDWFGSSELRGPLRIHSFLMEKFGSRCHTNFDKAICTNPIEANSSHMRTKHFPAYDVDLLNPKNFVTGITSLKTRAESDIEDEDTEMDTTPVVESEQVLPTSSSRVKNDDSDSDDSDEYNVRRSKRLKHNTPPSTPFKYLRRLPMKGADLSSIAISSDEDSSDDETEYTKQNKPQAINANDYSQLRYLEAFGTLRKTKPRHLGGFTECPIRLRISYRKNLTNQTTQFALIIYERRDQKTRTTIRNQRMLDFSKCPEDDDSHNDDLDCMDAQPAIIIPNESNSERDTLTIATVETPSSAEIATALEEAAFTIQPPIQRTPKKSTPIPPGTPKRRPRSSHMCMSGIIPLATTSTKKSNTPVIPKRSAARTLRL